MSEIGFENHSDATDIAYELQNFPNENRLFNLCVGETLGGKSQEVSRVFSKDSLVKFEHFDTNFMGAANHGYMVVTTKRPKMNFT